MKRVLSLLIFASCLFSFAQQRKASQIDVSQFPKVSFVWNEYNPNVVDGSQVDLFLDGKAVEFTWQTVSQSQLVNKNKSILILWEDMASHKMQSKFASSLLSDFFNRSIKSGDRFNVAVFNRDRGDGQCVKSITSGFTDDVFFLRESVLAYRYDTQKFKPNPISSNVYQAISEGLALLGSEPKANIKVIVVITAGFNMQSAGAPKEFGSIEAVNRNIPIYIVKFPLNNDKSRKDVDGLETATFGEMIVPLNIKDYVGAANGLYDSYTNLQRRHYGQDYLVTFEAPNNRDGKAHNITLNINGIDNKFSYTHPSFSLLVWAKENIVLAIFCVFGILALLTLVIVLIVVQNKKRKQKMKAIEQEFQDQQSQNLKRQKELEQQIVSERQDRISSAEIAKDEARRRDEQAKLDEAEAKLVKLMTTKHMYPRIVYAVGKQQFTYQVNSVLTQIGRTDDNDIVIDDMTVSRQHAKIAFTGAGFEIQNISHTNPTIVNGQFVDTQSLKSGDIIGIGKIILNFYL